MYADAWGVANGLKTAADAELESCNQAFAEAKEDVVAATAKQAAALANCKGVKYRLAQEAYKSWKAKKDADDETATQVASEWATESAPPTDGVAGAICAYPPVATDGT